MEICEWMVVATESIRELDVQWNELSGHQLREHELRWLQAIEIVGREVVLVADAGELLADNAAKLLTVRVRTCPLDQFGGEIARRRSR